MSLDTLQNLLPYLGSLALALGCSFWLWQRRTARGALPYALILLTEASWTFGYIFELVNPTLAGKIAWDDFQFIGSMAVPLAILAFALVYTERRLPQPRLVGGTQTGLLVIFLFLVYTDARHGLIRISSHLVTAPPFDALIYNFGPAMCLIVLWVYSNTLAGIGLLLIHFFRQHGLYRRQTGFVLLGVLVPLAGSILGVAGIALGGQRDITPFTFGVGNLLLAWGLFRYRTFAVRPIARDTVLENILEAIIILDDRQQVVDLNTAARRLFASHDLMGQPFAQAFAPWPDLREACHFPGSAKAALSLDLEGQPNYFELEYSPLKDLPGQVNGYLLVLRDVQASHKAQAELEQQVAARSAELSTANAELKQANLALQAEMAERQQAEQELEQHRFHLEELVKERTRELEQSRATALNLMQEAEQARARAEALLAELKESETALVVAKEAAEAASQAKSVFVAKLSHEICTPMNAIVGLTHLVLAGSLSAQQREYLVKLQDSAQFLLSILNDNLDFSKMEADKIEIEAVPFDLNQIFESLATMTGSWTRDKPLEVIFDMAPEMPMHLVGDPLRVEQVLINLGSNAAKFTPAGEVVFGTRVAAQAADYVTLEFSVRDTGIGMTPEQMGCLLTAFSQGDAATTRQYGGTGLGVTIAKRLIELMGGSIRVESQPGRGSCFTFSLPFKRTAAPASLQAEGLGLVKALVVEDNLTAQECLQNYLRAFVGEVQVVATGEAALDCLAAEPYDIVFLDWHLPGIDGVETARRLKAQPALYYHPHIVFVTAYGQEQITWQARELGVDGVLIKPASPSSLFNALVNAFRPAGAAPLARPESAAQPRLAGARVLVVEDNAINQDVARGLLEYLGVKVTVANSGEAALALLVMHSFDAVLMDVQMPELDGYEVTRRIRLNPAWARLPVIAMTAHAMVTDREKSLAAGMNDHVNKPVAPTELYAALARWLPARPAPPAQASQPAPMQVLNVSAGQNHTGGETDYLRVLGRFLGEYRDVAEIKAALASADIARAQILAHSLKGVAAMLGAETLQQTAKELEAALRQAPPAPWEALVSQVEQNLEAARAAMVAFRGSAP